ncbi:MAG TPA: DUF6027 family protein [Baekduia sp.]|nr:DUF6027 family protein [Baekduia sp.]
MSDEEPVIRLERWAGPWPDGDRDANFKQDIAAHALLDPLETLHGLSASTGVPVGALARYVLARWATAGSGGLLELGAPMVRRLHDVTVAAEADGTDEARLAAYDQLRQMLTWLRFPLDEPSVYGT